MKKRLLIIFIIVLAFVLRLWHLDWPLADWHSWRQADTAAVARNFIKNGIDLLHPRGDDISNVASLFWENPEGYRFVEFPVYNFAHALLYRIIPLFGFEAAGRLVSIISSLFSLIFIYLLTLKYSGQNTALWASFFYAVLPYNIYYSRVILPEPVMVALGLSALYFFDLWIEKNKIWQAILGVSLLALALLIKPFAAIFASPLLYIGYKKWGFNWKNWLRLLLLFIVSFLPFAWWRLWMRPFPEGIPNSSWLFNAGNIRLKGAFFYWLFGERLGKLILGYWGTVLLCLGLLVKPSRKEGQVFRFLLASVIFYFVIIAAGNVAHDYYQFIAIPIIVILLGKGANFLSDPPKRLSRLTTYFVLPGIILFSLAFSWYHVRDYYNINNFKIVEAGRAVDALVPKDALIVAPYGGDTAFLYQTNRKGWPIGIDIEKFINLGADYYVNVNFNPETDWLENVYCVEVKTADYVIINLKKLCQ